MNKKKLIGGLLVFTLLLGVLFIIQFSTPNLVDNDGYYHVKMAYLMRTDGIKPHFDWLPLTVLNSGEFVDHHFLYHILLVPFTFGDLRVGAKWAAVIFPALAFMAVRWLLKNQRVPFAALWTIARAASGRSSMALFRRVSLDLGRTAAADLPTDERLGALRRGTDDRQLLALYFQYGRYLLLASSRPGDLPANLQGIWAEGVRTPWSCDYHNNINVQMNYWPAELTALPECHQPLLDWIDTLRVPGRKTARPHYGVRGWVVHTINNVWGFTSPGEHPSWGQFPAAAGWLCQHLWEHYAFNGDRAYLERVYPILREAAEFYLDFLIEEPKHHWLVTSPSNSPENRFRTADGQEASVCYGPSMDQQIIHDLFSHCIQAAEKLVIDPEFRATLTQARARLAPPQIGRHGQLQEWIEDFDEPEPGHRHMSHLFALHAGNQITLRGTQELARAARASLERRLAPSTSLARSQQTPRMPAASCSQLGARAQPRDERGSGTPG